MKKHHYYGLIILALLATANAFGQQKDTAKVDYSVEKPSSGSTLEEKYNYFVRAKFEELNMFKIGLSSIVQISIANEHKLSPAFSILIDTRYNIPLDNMVFIEGVRYYYNMPRRIKQGKGANNFSGNYFSIQQVNDFSKFQSDVFRYYPSIDLLYGLQRRLWRRGYLDFSFGMGYNYNTRTYLPSLNFAIGLGF